MERHTYAIACRAGKGREGKRREEKGEGWERRKIGVTLGFFSFLALCFLSFLGFHKFVRVGFPIDSQMVRVFISTLNRPTEHRGERQERNENDVGWYDHRGQPCSLPLISFSSPPSWSRFSHSSSQSLSLSQHLPRIGP